MSTRTQRRTRARGLIALALVALGAGTRPKGSDQSGNHSMLEGFAKRIAHVTAPQIFALDWSEKDIQNLKEGQDRMTKLLVAVDRIARSHQIPYWICGGTLIGAKRHGGWIPWDGDMDIGMRMEDYHKFRPHAVKELAAGMWLQDGEDAAADSAHYPGPMGKIRDLNSDYEDYSKSVQDWHNGLQVDIFYADAPGCAGTTCCDGAAALPTVDVKFGTHTFPAPRSWQSMLEADYGSNWMTIPPLEARKPHEGRVAFEAPAWEKDMYPMLYPNRGEGRVPGAVFSESGPHEKTTKETAAA